MRAAVRHALPGSRRWGRGCSRSTMESPIELGMAAGRGHNGETLLGHQRAPPLAKPVPKGRVSETPQTLGERGRVTRWEEEAGSIGHR